VRAWPFNVSHESSVPLLYPVLSYGVVLDVAGRRTMQEDLSTRLVWLVLYIDAYMTWKVCIIYPKRQF
jgi:hypothetical protein